MATYVRRPRAQCRTSEAPHCAVMCSESDQRRPLISSSRPQSLKADSLYDQPVMEGVAPSDPQTLRRERPFLLSSRQLSYFHIFAILVRDRNSQMLQARRLRQTVLRTLKSLFQTCPSRQRLCLLV